MAFLISDREKSPSGPMKIDSFLFFKSREFKAVFTHDLPERDHPYAGQLPVVWRQGSRSLNARVRVFVQRRGYPKTAQNYCFVVTRNQLRATQDRT